MVEMERLEASGLTVSSPTRMPFFDYIIMTSFSCNGLAYLAQYDHMLNLYKRVGFFNKFSTV